MPRATLIAALLFVQCTGKPSGLDIRGLDIRAQIFRPPAILCYEGGIEVYLQSLTSAIEALNSQVGCPIVKLWEMGESCEIRVLFSERLSSVSYWAEAVYPVDGKGSVILVRDTYRPDATDMYVVFLHEMGHVLGLNHDDPQISGAQSVSVMTENIANHMSQRLKYGLPLPSLEEQDRAALRQRYCSVRHQREQAIERATHNIRTRSTT